MTIKTITDYLSTFPAPANVNGATPFLRGEQGDVLVEFFGVAPSTGQGSALPSGQFLYEVHWGSASTSVFVTYEETGNESADEAAYDVSLYLGGDAVGIDDSIQALTAVRDFAKQHGLDHLDPMRAYELSVQSV